MHGDKGTGEFFRMVRKQNSQSGIKQLQKEDGSFTQDLEDMRLVATNFYSTLLSSEGLSLAAEASRPEVWAAIHQKVTIEMRDTLNEPITVPEIAVALQELPKKSCPGEDGLTPDFYINN